MATKKITLAKVEMAQFALKELLLCVDLDAGARSGLLAALSLVDSLTPTGAKMADHTPVLYAPRLIGCKCGFRPASPASSVHAWMSSYHSHLAKIGCPRSNAPVLYGFGPDLGKPAF